MNKITAVGKQLLSGEGGADSKELDKGIGALSQLFDNPGQFPQNL